MLIHPDVETAIRLCLRHNRPFVAYSAPGSSTLHFHSSGATVECPGNRHFIISSFNSPVSEMLHIPLTHNAAETISLLADTIPSLPTYPSPLPQKPTTHSSYTAGLARVISHLRTHGGKCVISRAICGQYTDEADWIGFAKEYFNTFPDTHRYFYHTPQTGTWIVASPELLLRYDSTSMRLSTVSLAGTRIAGSKQPWDEKNIKEHNIVTDFITSTLRNAGIEPHTAPETSTMHFGHIEHLYDPIEAEAVLDKHQLMGLLADLSPTPALAGYPRKDALKLIEDTEGHRRLCYGGFIGFSEPDGSVETVVNLRCIHFGAGSYCIYAGGGIMPDSDPEQEWEETQHKSRTARDLAEKMIKHP